MHTINQKLIADIIEQTDIIEVIGNDIELFKKGANFIGICPFHEDNNPSFTVSPEKKIYKCFVCQEGGNVITYLQKQKQLTFQEAIVKLAREVGIDVKLNNTIIKNNIHYVLEEVYQYYQTILTTLESGRGCLDYLQHRGYQKGTIKKFKLGYAPKKVHLNEYLSKHANENKKYSLLDIEQSGVINNNREFFYDRLVIPISDEFNRIIGFSGRTLSNQEPKYLNSRESNLFKKKEVLYNLNIAKRYIIEQTIIFVEGFFDVFALEKIGVNNVVSLMGTAFTKEHINLLKKYKINKVYLLLDQDKAGIDSTLKIGELLIQEQFNFIKVVTFNNFKDIDEYLIENNNINILLKNAENFFEFKLTNAISKINIENVDEKFKLIIMFKEIIKNSQKELQVLMIHKIANSLKLNVEEVNKIYSINTKNTIENEMVNIESNWDNKNYFEDNNQIPFYSENKIKTSRNNLKIHTKIITDEAVCISYCLQGKKEFHEVVLAQEKGNIYFNVYKNMYTELGRYYNKFEKFNVIDFIDFIENPEYFSICENLLNNKLIDLTKIALILETPSKKIPAGRDLIRIKRR